MGAYARDHAIDQHGRVATKSATAVPKRGRHRLDVLQVKSRIHNRILEQVYNSVATPGVTSPNIT